MVGKDFELKHRKHLCRNMTTTKQVKGAKITVEAIEKAEHFKSHAVGPDNSANQVLNTEIFQE